jgi:hypothetical protein
MTLLAIALLLQIQYGGPPMWQQMPPPGAFDGPPGTMQPDGPAYGPGSPYNAPGMGNPDGSRPGWMDSAPPVPQQGPMGRPGNPWDDDGEMVLIQWDGRPNWQQMPNWDTYAPRFPTGRDDPNYSRDSQPTPYQEPPYGLGVRPGGNMDGDGDDMTWDGDNGYTQIQWGDDGWGDPQMPAYGGRQPPWNFFDPRDRYGNLPENRTGDYPSYWNAYPQPGAPQPQFPGGVESPYEEDPGWGRD